MFFLLRVAFWLTRRAGAAAERRLAAERQAKRRRRPTRCRGERRGLRHEQFCGRQPDACVVGSQAAVALGQRAQAGAKMVYEFFSEHARRRATTGSVPNRPAATEPVPPSGASQNTLDAGRPRCRPGAARRPRRASGRAAPRERRRTARPVLTGVADFPLPSAPPIGRLSRCYIDAVTRRHRRPNRARERP